MTREELPRAEIYGLPTDPAMLKEMMGTGAAESFFEGLKMELPYAILAGKMDSWTKCAETIVALLVMDSARRFPVSVQALPPSNEAAR